MTKNTRPLGLGLTNIGATLMSLGLPYDSNDAREYISLLYSLLTAHSYLVSSELAKELEPFPSYNRTNMQVIMNKHLNVFGTMDPLFLTNNDTLQTKPLWKKVASTIEKYGVRNSQVTCQQPTGTVSMILDTESFGIEPLSSLHSIQRIRAQETRTISYKCFARGLKQLGYTHEETSIISKIYMKEHTLTATSMKQHDYRCFECSLGDNIVSAEGQLKMLASIQPFISQAISKTITVSEDVSYDEISNIITRAWQLGIKGIAIYRNNSKLYQPIVAVNEDSKILEHEQESLTTMLNDVTKSAGLQRRTLSQEHTSITHNVIIAGVPIIIVIGLYEDGLPGSIHIRIKGSHNTLDGCLDGFSEILSLLFQYGIPLKVICNILQGFTFDPSGKTTNKDIQYTHSLFNYLSQWLTLRFIQHDKALNITNAPRRISNSPRRISNSPICKKCHVKMIRQGTCHVCPICGDSTGCS